MSSNISLFSYTHHVVMSLRGAMTSLTRLYDVTKLTPSISTFGRADHRGLEK